jgi:hypothetical protein
MGSLFFEIKEGRVSSEAALFRIKKKAASLEAAFFSFKRKFLIS